MSGELQAAIARAQTLQARSLGYRDAGTRYGPERTEAWLDGLNDAVATSCAEPAPDCSHPPTRLYAWHAYDGTACVCCCDCGAVLAGGVDV